MNILKIISFLGNDNLCYSKTLHNLGYIIYDNIYKNFKDTFKNNCDICYQIKNILIKNNIKEEYFFIMSNCDLQLHIVLMKPYTGMNNSGKFVYEINNFIIKKIENIKLENFIIYDDIDINFPFIKIKINSKSSTHNGIRSLIIYLKNNFVRIKFGIKNIENIKNLSKYVLSNFSHEQLEKIKILSNTYFYNFINEVLTNINIDDLQKKFNNKYNTKVIEKIIS